MFVVCDRWVLCAVKLTWMSGLVATDQSPNDLCLSRKPQDPGDEGQLYAACTHFRCISADADFPPILLMLAQMQQGSRARGERQQSCATWSHDASFTLHPRRAAVLDRGSTAKIEA